MSDHFCKHDDASIDDIRLVYVIAILLWILIIWCLELYNTDLVGILILAIPIIFYVFSIFVVVDCTKDTEKDVLQTDVLLFGSALITVFVSVKYIEYSSYFYKLIFIGVLLAAIGSTDIWLSKKHAHLYKHIKIVLQTASTFIFVFLFYTFYVVAYNTSEVNVNPFTDIII